MSSFPRAEAARGRSRHHPLLAGDTPATPGPTTALVPTRGVHLTAEKPRPPEPPFQPSPSSRPLHAPCHASLPPTASCSIMSYCGILSRASPFGMHLLTRFGYLSAWNCRVAIACRPARSLISGQSCAHVFRCRTLAIPGGPKQPAQHSDLSACNQHNPSYRNSEKAWRQLSALARWTQIVFELPRRTVNAF